MRAGVLLTIGWCIAAHLAVATKPAVAQQRQQEKPSAALPDSWASQIQWRNIGPANMGGRIVDLQVNPKDLSQWWAASASGGLLMTENNGVTFEHQFDQQATVSIGAFAVSESDPSIIWVGTGEENPRNSSSYGDGVYKSTDGGKTWKNMGLSKIFQTGAVSIHPTDPNIVYVGALGRLWGPNEDRGLFKTTDGGETWEKVLYVDDRTGVIDIVINPKKPNHMLAATYCRMRDGFDGNDPEVKFGEGAGIWRSTDGGDTWERITKGLPATEMGRIGLCYYEKDPKWVYAVIESKKIGQLPDTFPYLGLQGADAEVGAKITEVTEDGPAATAGLLVDDVIVQAGKTLVLDYNDLLAETRKRKAGDTLVLSVARDGEALQIKVELALHPDVAERLEEDEEEATDESEAADDASSEEGEEAGDSTDEESNDEADEEEEPSVNEQLNELRRGSPFAQSLGGQNPNYTDQQGENGEDFGGIYRSKDGGASWTRINSLNPRPMYYSKIKVDPSDNNYIWVLGTQLYLSEDGGKTFSDNGAGGEVHVDHHALWIDPTDGRHVILGNDGGIYVTFDRGKNWDHHNHVVISQFYHVGIDTTRDYKVYGGLQDNGSWGGPSIVRRGQGPINSDWIRIGGGDGFVCLVDPTDPDQLYYESQNGAMGRNNLRTGERGGIRPRAPRGTRYRFNWKTPFILSPHNPEIHFSAGNYVFRSVKKGADVQPISPEITLTDQGAGSAIGQSPLDENVLYVGTTDGALWRTTDGGKTWNDVWKPETMQDANSGRSGNRVGRGGPGGRGGFSGRSGFGGRGPGRGGFGGGRGPGRGGFGGRGRGPGGPPQNRSEEASSAEPPATDANADEASDESESKTDDPPAEEASAAADSDSTSETEAASSTDEPQTEEKPAEETIAEADPVSGTWTGQFDDDRMPAERASFRMALKRNEEGEYVGQYETAQSAGDLVDGKFNESTSTLTIQGGDDNVNLAFKATVKGDTIKGTFSVNNGAFSLEFSAERTSKATELGAADAQDASEDDGEPLKELLPKPMWISSIEPSKFVEGRCYVTVDGHRSDVDGPFVLVTENYGKSWKRLDETLPEATGSTRVIREDIENRDLLYLGTEFGLFISIDRGQTWNKIQDGLPTVAVHEIAQHPTAGEIVAGTHGRGIWIADVTALRQFTVDTVSEDVVLYEPATVVRWRSLGERGASGTRRFVGENPNDSAMIYYSLGRAARSIELEIRDIEGHVLQRLEVPGEQGLHAIEWDLRLRSSGQGGRRRFAPRVENGEYLVALIVNDETYTRTITIESDPEYETSGRAENEAEFVEALFSTTEEGEND